MLGSRYNYDGKAVIRLSDVQLGARTAFLRKMQQLYHLVDVNCVCGSDCYEILSEKDRYGLPVTTVICKKCGLIYQNPRPDDDSLNDFYCNLYRKLYETSTISRFFDSQFIRGKRIVHWVYDMIGHLPKKVIEIGCGAGGILKAFQNKGAQILGVDFDEAYINYGRSKGLQLEIGGAGKVNQQNIDLIIFSHVLEHFSNIQAELNAIRDLLSIKGCLYIELPGIFNLKQYSYDFLKSLQNAHNYYFTLGTLKQVLGLYGWELEQGNEEIYSLFRYTGHRSNISGNYYPEILRRLIYFEKTRRIGQIKYALSKNRLTQLGMNALRVFRD
jgi:2-polyprenyl-3-methyl-5-hydroxy-6-metoxy-1,4-benzoquinol methylase